MDERPCDQEKPASSSPPLHSERHLTALPGQLSVKDVFPTAPSALPVGGCFILASSKEELSVLVILYVIVLHFEMDLKHQGGICPLPSLILPRERDWK